MAKLITFSGKTQSISSWARELGINPLTLIDRLGRNHWPIEMALTRPVRKPADKRGQLKPNSTMLSPYRATKVNGKTKAIHICIAEKALGKPLPKGTVVHHVNYDGLDNRNSNLVVCPTPSYHNLLHMRTDALIECGNANFRWCRFCNKYDDPLNMHQYSGERIFMHRECRRLFWLRRKANAKRKDSQQSKSG